MTFHRSESVFWWIEKEALRMIVLAQKLNQQIVLRELVGSHSPHCFSHSWNRSRMLSHLRCCCCSVLGVLFEKRGNSIFERLYTFQCLVTDQWRIVDVAVILRRENPIGWICESHFQINISINLKFSSRFFPSFLHCLPPCPPFPGQLFDPQIGGPRQRDGPDWNVLAWRGRRDISFDCRPMQILSGGLGGWQGPRKYRSWVSVWVIWGEVRDSTRSINRTHTLSFFKSSTKPSLSRFSDPYCFCLTMEIVSPFKVGFLNTTVWMEGLALFLICWFSNS
jgi:hypothetical protein